MSDTRNCLYSDQAVALALHALEPGDEDVLARHVPECATCQTLVRQTQDVVWGLAAEAEQVQPPARLRESLMAAVASTEQVPVEQRERPWIGEPTAPSVRAAAALPRQTAAPSPDVLRRASVSDVVGYSPRRRKIIILITAAVALAGVGGVTAELLQRASHEERYGLAAVSPEVTRIFTDLDRSGARHAVLYAPDGQAKAAVVQFPDTRKVMPLRLAANLAKDTVYVLWGLDDGVARALGTFDVAAPSETMLTVSAPEPSQQFTRYAISIERGRIAPLSPGLVVAEGKVAG